MHVLDHCFIIKAYTWTHATSWCAKTAQIPTQQHTTWWPLYDESVYNVPACDALEQGSSPKANFTVSIYVGILLCKAHSCTHAQVNNIQCIARRQSFISDIITNELKHSHLSYYLSCDRGHAVSILLITDSTSSHDWPYSYYYPRCKCNAELEK